MNQIVREIYLLRDRIKDKIEVTQGSDGYQIELHVMDFEIESGTTAKASVKKPSGKEILDDAVVDVESNSLIIDLDKQMTAESGQATLQVELSKDGRDVFSYAHPMIVSASNLPIESTTGSPLLDKYIEKMKNATENATNISNAIEEKAENGEFTATIEVGETITGPAESVAAVENLGDKQNAILQFTIPRGKQGESGVMVPTAGMFTLSVDSETGNMYCDYVGDTAPVFELEENGDLYYTIPEA